MRKVSKTAGESRARTRLIASRQASERGVSGRHFD
jgi:hypothetical protein